jgi:hypothetical protein
MLIDAQSADCQIARCHAGVHSFPFSSFAFLPTREQTQGMKNLNSGEKSKNAYTVPTQLI